MAGSNELCAMDVITEICKKEHIRGNASILKQLLEEFCKTPVVGMVQNSDVQSIGGGEFDISVIDDPRDGYIAITEDLTFYEFDGTAWTLKFAGLGGFIASASDNGDDTYTFTSFDGSTNFTIAIPILSVDAGPGIDVDVSDPKRPAVGLNQASQDSLDLADSAVQPADSDISTANWVLDEDDMVSDSDEKVPTQQSVKAYVDAFHEYLVIDQNQIFSKRGSNEIQFPNSDIILSVNSTQANKIMGASSLRNIVGGYDNVIVDNIASSIFGSHHSIIESSETYSITGGHNSIIGGSNNKISSSYSSIVGGVNTEIDTARNTFAGAVQNTKIMGNGYIGVIGVNGGVFDENLNNYIFVAGAQNPVVSGTGSHRTITGGQNSEAGFSYSFVGQGSNNKAMGNRSTVLNGAGNEALGDYSTVINGVNNIASGYRSIVINGTGNEAQSYVEVILGHYAETVAGNFAVMRDQDRAFTVGVGRGDTDRRSAFTVWKSGRNEVMFLKIRNVVPDTLEDGDIFFDGTDLKIHIGGTTKTFSLV